MGQTLQGQNNKCFVWTMVAPEARLQQQHVNQIATMNPMNGNFKQFRFQTAIKL